MNDVCKCLVLDLDDTLWRGVCLEGPVAVPDASRRVLRTLDQRGILLSIASRSEHSVSWQALVDHGLAHYFVAPHINWLPKPTNVATIARELELGTEALAFVDDDPFEREQMRQMMPEVAVFDAAELARLTDLPEFRPANRTKDASRRRLFYQAEGRRREAEARFATRSEFLAWCDMRLRVRVAEEQDLARVMELTTRTHQLNTTGAMLEESDVRAAIRRGLVHVADLEDRFGTYGTIGVALVETDDRTGGWCLDYFALSCRVMGRGIERAFLVRLLEGAAERGCREARARFRDTGRNRMMRALYQMMGLRDAGAPEGGSCREFHADLTSIQPAPEWVVQR